MSEKPIISSIGIRAGLNRTKPVSRKNPTLSSAGLRLSRISPTIQTAAKNATVEKIISRNETSAIFSTATQLIIWVMS